MPHRPIKTVSEEQIAAAGEILRHHMPGPAATHTALSLLRDSVPGMDEDAVLLKAAAVDRLYYTNCRHLGALVERIVQVLAAPPQCPVVTVETIAPIRVGDSTHWFWSFTSKFCHWFVSDDLPICDSWAERTLGRHFGGIAWQTTRYRDFAEHVAALRRACDIECSTREFDGWLWLWGMHDGWLANPTVGISGQARNLFESQDAAVQALVAAL